MDEIVRRPYTVEVAYGETADDGVLARIAEWPGCMTAAETRAEAVARLEDAMRDWVEAATGQGLRRSTASRPAMRRKTTKRTRRGTR